MLHNGHASVEWGFSLYKKLRPLGGGSVNYFFFTKINFGFYIKALSTNYELVFTELKKTSLTFEIL